MNTRGYAWVRILEAIDDKLHCLDFRWTPYWLYTWWNRNVCSAGFIYTEDDKYQDYRWKINNLTVRFEDFDEPYGE